MAILTNYPFQAVKSSSGPSFQSTLGNAATIYALESTGAREWQLPSARVIRIASKAADDFYIKVGSSDAALTVNSTLGTSQLILGGTVELIRVEPGQTHIGVASSTDVVMNVTLGIGS